jgi:aspartate/methionine/tyrosine aminotransferase
VAALQAAGVDVINLIGGGTREFDLVDDAKEQIVRELLAGPMSATEARGAADLRTALAGLLREEKGVELDPELIAVTAGAKEATMATFMALLDVGDEVLVPDPAWVGYEPWIRRVGALPVRFSMGRGNGFRPDWDELAGLLSARTRLLILTNPHNPTGTLLTRAELERLGEVLDGSDVLVVSDESNSQIVFDGRSHVSPLEVPSLAERTLLFRSFSKDYAMPGWRIGWVWAPQPHFDAILAAHEHAVSSVPTLIQRSALAVLNSPGPAEMVARMLTAFHERRAAFVAALDAIPGVSCHAPEGAYNVFPDISMVARSCGELAPRLLDAGVATVPGAAFGRLGAGHLRMAFTLPEARLVEAAQRLRGVVT